VEPARAGLGSSRTRDWLCHWLPCGGSPERKRPANGEGSIGFARLTAIEGWTTPAGGRHSTTPLGDAAAAR
jgi:hypothetical protein